MKRKKEVFHGLSFSMSRVYLFDGEGNGVYIYKGPVALKREEELKRIEKKVMRR